MGSLLEEMRPHFQWSVTRRYLCLKTLGRERQPLFDAQLAPSEAAERIGISVQAVDRAARRGRLEHVWTPLGRIFPSDAVEQYAQEREARLRGER